MGITTANDPVNHPSHYTSHPSGVETLEVTRQLGFSCGNAVKYVWRRADKGSTVQDLRKAAVYLRDALDNSQLSMGVPAPAAHILAKVAAAEPDPMAAKFYVAVAEMRWLDAESVVKQMIDAIDPDE